MLIKCFFGLYSRCLRISSLAVIGLLATACATTSEQPVFIAMSSEIVPPDGLQRFCIDHPEECGGEIVQATLLSSEPTAGQGGRNAISADPETEGAGSKADRSAVTVEAGIVSTDFPDALPPALEATDVLQEESIDPEPEGVSSSPSPERERLQADTRTMQLLQTVNRDINRQLEWVEDREIYGMDELWTLPLTFGISRQGDCEDFALEKRRALIARGIPAAALSLATAYSPETGRHAVLIVHTTIGDLVLDNANQWIREWTETDYRWTGIQASADIMDWRMFANS